MSKFTDKQQAFINEYLKCWNATEAALRAGYSKRTARSIGHENLTKPDIAKEISKRIEEMVMSADEALASLSDIARGDLSDFFDIAGKLPIINFEKAAHANALGLLKKIKFKDGEISFELYDKQRALETVAKHHGLLAQKVNIDINIMVEVVEALETLGQDPSQVFNEIIQRAKVKQDAD